MGEGRLRGRRERKGFEADDVLQWTDECMHAMAPKDEIDQETVADSIIYT